MFVVTVTFEAQPAHAEAFLSRVRQQAEDTLASEEGCVRFDVSIDPERPGRVFLYEIYRSEAAFRLHLTTTHFKSFDADAEPMVASKAIQTWELAS
jgi:autoinducer 2-degrading protein